MPHLKALSTAPVATAHRSSPYSPHPLEHLNGILPVSALRELADCREERKNTKSINARRRFSDRFPHINTVFYTKVTRSVLARFYPKRCPHCGKEMLGGVSTRESVIRCLKCNYMDSCTAYTPLHHLKLPLWVFSYLLMEAVQRFPQVLSAEEIRRKLGVAKSTSTLLKRRLQVFLSDLQPRIKEIIVEEIQKNKGLILPEGDVSSVIQGKTVVSIDGHALFSATQRANGGRARWKHGGQTASVYLTDEVAEQKGKYQIGTLCHTLALKKGPIILDSVPTFKQKHIQPLLEFLPANTPVFSDDGYPWYGRYNLNHRSVNHSARGKDRKRSVWARDRWSRLGIHNNVAEGNGRILKHAFIAGYSYITPEKSRMYLNEFSSLKAIRIYSLSGLGNVGDSDRVSAKGRAQKADHGYLRRRIAILGYLPPTRYERDFLDRGNARKLIRKNLRELLDQNEFYEARQAHLDYLSFWEDAAPYRKQIERRYGAIAQELWKRLHRWDERLLVKIAQDMSAPHRLLMRMARKWKHLGLASCTEKKNPEGRVIHFWAKRSVTVLPDMLYSFDMRQYRNQQIKHDVLNADRRLSRYGMNKQERKKALERSQ